jgi:ankyrin repeat protein
MYYDAYEVHDLLDKWNHRGPPITESVADLFDRNPQAARQEFLFGSTLLHKCMEFYLTRMDLVQLLVATYPDALSKPDDNGFLPLHRALICASCTPTLELMKLFLGECPESILSTTVSGAFPLHLACKRCDLEVVQFLVECFPEVLQYRDKERKFPLDHALEDNGIERTLVVEYLVQKNPVLLTFSDEEGRLPLHRVLRMGKRTFAYDKIVDILVDSCPGSLLFQDGEGCTPLLQACSESNSLSQVYSLVRKWPEQITTQSNLITEPDEFNGEMLWSTLSSQSIRLDRVRQWTRLHPEVILTPDLQGRLPLHYAVVSSSEEVLEIVQFLLEQLDSVDTALAIPDHHGRLPMHYAASSPFSDVVINYLMEIYPEGLTHADNDGRLPWHYADCARQDIVFETTCQLYPDIDTDLDLVPEEIRWDVIQVIPDD